MKRKVLILFMFGLFVNVFAATQIALTNFVSVLTKNKTDVAVYEVVIATMNDADSIKNLITENEDKFYVQDFDNINDQYKKYLEIQMDDKTNVIRYKFNYIGKLKNPKGKKVPTYTFSITGIMNDNDYELEQARIAEEKRIAEENERKENERKEKERKENKGKGFGEYTNDELTEQRQKNKVAGNGELTDSEVQKYTEKALTYEKNKEWIYALGVYYDSGLMGKFNELLSVIKSGKPGKGDFNAFELHDEWKRLMENYNKYFAEFPPFSIMFMEPSIGSIDYTKRTAKMGLKYELILSKKFELISDAYEKGFSEAKKSDWEDLEAQKVYSYTYNYGNYGKDSIASNIKTFSDLWNQYCTDGKAGSKITQTTIDKMNKEIKNYYQSSKVPVSVYVSHKEIFKMSAWNHSYDFYSEYGIPHITVTESMLYSSQSRYSCYDIKFGIYDNKDKLILEGKRQTVTYYALWDSYEEMKCNGWEYKYWPNQEIPYENAKYYFPDIDATMIDKIQKGEVKVKLMGMWLNYGVQYYPINFAENTTQRDEIQRKLIKNMPEIKIPLENIRQITLSKEEVMKRYDAVDRNPGK